MQEKIDNYEIQEAKEKREEVNKKVNSSILDKNKKNEILNKEINEKLKSNGEIDFIGLGHNPI